MRRAKGVISAFIFVLVASLGAGCSSTNPSATGWGGKHSEVSPSEAVEDVPGTTQITNRARSSESGENRSFNDAGLQTQLLDVLSHELHSWLGTPHVWGGTGKNGVDCSGLIQTVYASSLGIYLPRTTAELKNIGTKIGRSDLETGDLVFFKPDGDGRHVGIYMANHEFIHSSSSRGVMRSRLTESYWDRYYDTARRVFVNPDEIRTAISYGRNAKIVRADLTRR